VVIREGNLNMGANHSSVKLDQPKTEKQINQEIASIIRQITACVSFLPILEPTDMTFNVLCYTSKSVQPLGGWVDSDAKVIGPGEQVVGLRSFSTGSHAVGGMVSYRIDDDA
jgi:mitotic spindle assembly checkpoint protein MAD2